MIKKIIILILSIFVANHIGFGQDTLKISSLQAVEMALSKRLDVQSSDLNIRISEKNLDRTKNQYLPEINFTGNLRYNTTLATNVLPAGFGGNPNVSKVKFGTKNNTTLAFDFSQNIYKPTLKADLKIAQKNIDAEQINHNQNRLNIKYMVLNAYFNALLKQKTVVLAIDYAQKAKQIYAISTKRFELGALLENERLKQQLDYQNADIKQKKAQQDLDLALKNLKNEINIDPKTNLILTDNLEQSTPIDPKTTLDVQQKNELKKLKINTQINQLRTQRAYANLLPSVSLNANYTAQFQAQNFDFSQDLWFPFNYVGLRVNVPLFNQFRNKSDANEYKIKANQSQLDFAHQQNKLQYQAEQAQTELANATLNLDYAAKNLELARTIFNTDASQYTLGKINYTDLLNTSKAQNDAENNYLQAVFNHQIAWLNAQKSLE